MTCGGGLMTPARILSPTTLAPILVILIGISGCSGSSRADGHSTMPPTASGAVRSDTGHRPAPGVLPLDAYTGALQATVVQHATDALITECMRRMGFHYT